MELKYERKYKRLKRSIKNYILENSSIGDEVGVLQAELAAAREERMYLIERLMFHEGLEKSGLLQNELANERNEHSEKHPAGTNSDLKNDAYLKKKNSIKHRNVPVIQKKKNSQFPINVNNVLVHSLGEIIPVNPNFHTAHWIYPVGYVATRIYAHPKDPRKKCVFTCKILNNAGIPQFQIIPDNDLDSVLFGETANMCHEELLKTIQNSLKDSTKVSFKVQGESFFGLSSPKVQSLLKLDAGFKHCANFEGYINHNEAVAEDKDPNLCFDALQLLIN